jgi:maleate isomerase
MTDAVGHGPVGIGVVTPYDFALDAELWRWLPPAVTLHLTRTPYLEVPVTVEQAVLVGDTQVVARVDAGARGGGLRVHLGQFRARPGRGA